MPFDWSNVDTIDEARELLTSDGYEYSNSNTACGGAIIEETWTNGSESYSFCHEYGSKYLADPYEED